MRCCELALLALVGLVTPMACSSTTTTDPSCTPGATEPCQCGTQSGRRECDAERRFGDCECTTGAAGAGGGAGAGTHAGGAVACMPRGPEESLAGEQLAAVTCDDANADACDGCDCGRARRFVSLGLGDEGTFTNLTESGPSKTLELWIRQQEPSAGVIVTAGVLQLELAAGGVPSCTKSGDEHVYGDSPIAARTWTHVACVAGETSLTVFVDGVEASSMSTGRFDVLSPQGLAPEANVLTELDEIRYSSVARYAEPFDPEQRFQNDEHTLALWHLDEGSSPAFDSAGSRRMQLPADLSWVPDDCYDGRFP